MTPRKVNVTKPGARVLRRLEALGGGPVELTGPDVLVAYALEPEGMIARVAHRQGCWVVLTAAGLIWLTLHRDGQSVPNETDLAAPITWYNPPPGARAWLRAVLAHAAAEELAAQGRLAGMLERADPTTRDASVLTSLFSMIRSAAAIVKGSDLDRQLEEVRWGKSEKGGA